MEESSDSNAAPAFGGLSRAALPAIGTAVAERALSQPLSVGLNTPPVLVELVLTGEIFSPGNFTPEARRQIEQIAAGVSLHDSNGILAFAVEPQMRLNQHLDPLLDGIKGDDIGYGGQLVAELARNIKALDLPAARKEAENGPSSVMGMMPAFIQNRYSAIQRFRARGAEVKTMLEKIEAGANTHMLALQDGTRKLDHLVDACVENIGDLRIWLAAGQMALLQMRTDYAAARIKAIASRDPVELEEVRDMSEQINAFETRLVRIHLAYTQSTLAIPQIRTQQQAGRIEFQNMLNTVIESLPAIKRAVIQIAGLNQIRAAHAGADATQALNREMSKMGIEALETSYLMAKDTQGNMAADVAALAESAERTLAMIERGTRMDEENRKKRDSTMTQIGLVREKLLDGLQSHAKRSVGI